MNGNILNIQRFCTDDGPGIRTTVFLKGCPLSCVWCHNPESQSPKRELMYAPDKCLHCLQCTLLCPVKCHKKGADGHEFDRTACISCGRCLTVLCDALEGKGDIMSADEVLAEVRKDKAFYENSGGGLTLSGGEPLSQSAFCRELLTKAKAEGIHVCIETCGFATRQSVAEIAPLVDIFLFDYKESDPERHKTYTGAELSVILQNLQYLDSLGKRIILRCPIIPGYNDRPDHFEGIASLASSLSHIEEITVEPYHTLGADKYRRLDRDYTLSQVTAPPKDTVRSWVATIQAHTKVPVRSAIG